MARLAEECSQLKMKSAVKLGSRLKFRVNASSWHPSSPERYVSLAETPSATICGNALSVLVTLLECCHCNSSPIVGVSKVDRM